MKAKNVSPRDLLDRQLGRVTMYRLVTLVLLALVVVMLGFTINGTFTAPYTVKNELLTLVVLLAASYTSSRLLGLLWRIRPHGESAIITALLLWFIFTPSTDTTYLLWLSLGAFLANLSKYVLAWRGRHVFNPAAAGAFLMYAIQYAIGRDAPVTATWWIGNKQLLPFVVVGAFLVLWRTRRLDVGVLFIVVSGVLVVLGLDHVAAPGAPLTDAIKTMAYSFPLVFIAGFMLSEPLTLPPRRHQQLVVAVVTAVAVSYNIWVLLITSTPPNLKVFAISNAVAILIGNVVAFAFGRRRGVALELVGKRKLTPETHELTFRAKRGVGFLPGQFAEITIPHSHADSRGMRRSFSISSPPNADGQVSIAVRVPPESSTYKKALLGLEPGQTVHATGVGGDFVLPKDPAVPLLLVAGGIGITPFLSQLRHHQDRDAVLVYGVTGPEEISYADELAGFNVVLVSAARPDHLPTTWTWVAAPFLSAEIIASAVPDLA
ncbi:MAG: glycine betaine catabolism, partial [Nocardioidaceae bacterium]|nr:glycine betaine catabolism [Nocardioidaceae bacterium]